MSKKNDNQKNAAAEALRFSIDYNVEILEANAAAAADRVEKIRAFNSGTVAAALARLVDNYDADASRKDLNAALKLTDEERNHVSKNPENHGPGLIPITLAKGTGSMISAGRYQRLADKLKLVSNEELVDGQVDQKFLSSVPAYPEKVECFTILYPSIEWVSVDTKPTPFANDDAADYVVDNVFRYDRAKVLAALETNAAARERYEESLKAANREARKRAVDLAAQLAGDASDTDTGVTAFNKRLDAVATAEAWGDVYDHPHAFREAHMPNNFASAQYRSNLERLSASTNTEFTRAHFNTDLLLPVPEFDGTADTSVVTGLYKVQLNKVTIVDK